MGKDRLLSVAYSAHPLPDLLIHSKLLLPFAIYTDIDQVGAGQWRRL